MKLTPEQRAAGLAASYALRDCGDPARDIKPTTFTANPSLHVDAIGEAILALKALPPIPEMIAFNGADLKKLHGACERAKKSAEPAPVIPAFMGMLILLDDSLPDGVFELHSGDQVVRVDTRRGSR